MDNNLLGKEILNYIIISEIGAGGMGSVFLAEHKFIKEQRVAIKVIKGERFNVFAKERLEEEAKRLASLDHPNIVKFLNYDIDAEGNVYLIMEYAKGATLDKYINTMTGLIVESKILPLFEPILDAFDYAHKKKIVHRDIKPANIIITTEGIPKILDFGISTILDDSPNADNEEACIMGTPSYMSPEQVRGKGIDTRSDVYSLGVLLHQMLTGNAPYDTTTMSEYEINEKVIAEQLPRMKTFYHYVSDKLQTIVDKATSKKPEERYQTCADFKKAVHKAIVKEPIPRWAFITAIAAAVLLIGGGFYIWDYSRIKVRYYKDYVEQWGVPQGIGRLSKNEMHHREQSYRFEYQKRKLRQFSLVNSREKITTHHDSEHVERPSDMLLFYADNGNLDYVKILDNCGKVLYKKDYNDKLNTVIFQYDDEFGSEFTLTARTLELNVNPFDNNMVKGRISRYLLTYDEEGYIIKLQYAGAFNSSIGDAEGIYGRTYVRDRKGRVIEEHYLGFDGKPKGTKGGLGIRKHKFDDNDDWVETAYFTVNGEASTDATGVPIVRLEVDKYGNRIKESYVNAQGEYVLRTDMGASGVKYLRNDEGLCVETTYFGTDGQLCYNKEGYVGYWQEYDENGYEKKLTCFDINKEKCVTSFGWASRACVSNESGNVVESWTYDLRDSLVETDGYAGFKLKYDERGNRVECVSYGLDKKPCLMSDGTVGYRAEFNDRNLMTKLVNIGIDLLPCKDNNGVTVTIQKYDQQGNQTETAYYGDEENVLVLSNENIAGWSSVYDDHGNEVSRKFFDRKKQPCICSEGYAMWTAKYDDRGNQQSFRYFNLKGGLILVDGSAGWDYKQDERGNILENIAVGIDGRLAQGKLIARYKYDNYDNEIEFALYENNNKPALNSYNYHKYTCKYNDRNQRVEIRYYGTDSNLTLYEQDNYAIQKDEYDEKGNCVRTFFYGKNQQPVCSKEGWASSVRVYNAMGKVIKQSFFDIQGHPTAPKDMVPEGFCKYDKWGNMIYLATGDGKGNFIINPRTGWSIERMEYDSRGKLLTDAFYNEKDKPMISLVEGYHKSVASYTQAGNDQQRAYFDAENKPMNCPEGYHKEVYEYNGNNQAVKLSYWGVRGGAVDCKNGYHKIELTYNDSSEIQSRKYYSAGGKLLLTQRWTGSEWVSGTQPASESAANSDWQSAVRELSKSCPINMGEEYGDMVVQSISASATSCTVIFKVSYSKYELGSDKLAEYKDNVYSFITQLKKELVSVPVVGILYDSKGRELSKQYK